MTEPVPVVDDDLLREIGIAAYNAWDNSGTASKSARLLLASEPMQRYVTVKQQEAVDAALAELGL